mgnify:CR=1 FL=1
MRCTIFVQAIDDIDLDTARVGASTFREGADRLPQRLERVRQRKLDARHKSTTDQPHSSASPVYHDATRGPVHVFSRNEVVVVGLHDDLRVVSCHGRRDGNVRWEGLTRHVVRFNGLFVVHGRQLLLRAQRDRVRQRSGTAQHGHIADSASVDCTDRNRHINGCCVVVIQLDALRDVQMVLESFERNLVQFRVQAVQRGEQQLL